MNLFFKAYGLGMTTLGLYWSVSEWGWFHGLLLFAACASFGFTVAMLFKREW